MDRKSYEFPPLPALSGLSDDLIFRFSKQKFVHRPARKEVARHLIELDLEIKRSPKSGSVPL